MSFPITLYTINILQIFQGGLDWSNEKLNDPLSRLLRLSALFLPTPSIESFIVLWIIHEGGRGVRDRARISTGTVETHLCASPEISLERPLTRVIWRQIWLSHTTTSSYIIIRRVSLLYPPVSSISIIKLNSNLRRNHSKAKHEIWLISSTRIWEIIKELIL